MSTKIALWRRTDVALTRGAGPRTRRSSVVPIFSSDPPDHAAACHLATAYPKAKSIWRDDERGGALVRDEPVVVHCYTTAVDIEDSANLAELGNFCRKMGREAHQGEIGLVVGDEYFGIHDFEEA